MSTVVDNTNGNIVWSGSSWQNGDKADDTMVDRYFNSTFRHSVNNGDSASISWKGTDIAVYGARRDNHGIYSVSIDSGAPEYFSGYATGEGQFQAVLFATNGLTSGDHTLKIANENSRNIEQYPKYIYLDVDYFALTGELLPGPGGGAPAPSPSSSSSSSSMPTSSASSSEAPVSSSPSSSIDRASSSASSAADVDSASSSNTGFLSTSETGVGTSVITSASAVTVTTTDSDSSISQVNPTAAQFTDTGSSRPVTATEGVESMKTSGIPNVSPLTTSTGSIAGAEGGSDYKDEGSKKTTIAVSVSVISVAVVVICTVLGLYLYKRRKAGRELEEISQQDHIMSQRDWDY